MANIPILGANRQRSLGRVKKATVDLPTRKGRGVLVPGGFVVTAAHCVSYTQSGAMALVQAGFEKARTREGKNLLLEIVAVEPVADIAVLGPPDEQQMPEAAKRFDKWRDNTEPVMLYRNYSPPFMHAPSTTIIGTEPPPLDVLVLNKDWHWVKSRASFSYHGSNSAKIWLEASETIECGALGGPIITMNGELLAIVSGRSEGSCEGAQPQLSAAMPAWLTNTIFEAGLDVVPKRRRRPHKTVAITCPFTTGKTPIDEELAPLIRAIWRVGIQTFQCCQEIRPGVSEIRFATAGGAEAFLEIVKRNYRVELETWDEGDLGEPAIQIRLVTRFPKADIPLLVERFRLATRK